MGNNLQSWWGTEDGRTVLLVARDVVAAAKLAGVTGGSFPFRFRVRLGPLPYGVGRAGLYRNVGGAWVRDEPAKGPPDLEEPS